MLFLESSCASRWCFFGDFLLPSQPWEVTASSEPITASAQLGLLFLSTSCYNFLLHISATALLHASPRDLLEKCTRHGARGATKGQRADFRRRLCWRAFSRKYLFWEHWCSAGSAITGLALLSRPLFLLWKTSTPAAWNYTLKGKSSAAAEGDLPMEVSPAVCVLWSKCLQKWEPSPFYPPTSPVTALCTLVPSVMPLFLFAVTYA